MGAFGGAVGTVLNTAALFIFSQAIANQSPTQAGAKPLPVGEKKDPEIRGILRVTRHPMFTALGTWGLANCFKRGRLGDLGKKITKCLLLVINTIVTVYWAPFPIFYLIGCAHQDMREKETLSENFYNKVRYYSTVSLKRANLRV
jgi:protein-S-isoprenylcysteine O-methyltransferase Ste14